MFIHPAYKAIKTRLATQITAPIFFYIGQYESGKENTSYVVPALYIEFPKDLTIDFFPRKRMVTKPITIKVHYISHAPFKNHDNAIQDSALTEHNKALVDIDKLLNGWNAVEEGSTRILTQQLVPVGGSFLSFKNKSVVSVIDYSTEIFSSHMQEA